MEYISKGKGKKKPEFLGNAYLEENLGIEGDLHSIGGGKRQVSIFTEEGWKEIRDKELKGLCINKFYENIRVKDLNLDNISEDSTLVIGEALLKITEMGKTCFPECNIVKEKKNCPLHKEVVFAKVLKGGEIKIGDKLY